MLPKGGLALLALAAAVVLPPRMTAPPASAQSSAARFTPHTIDTGLTGGYQVVVTDLNADGKPDVIALASGLKELRWYENPNWDKHILVTGIDQPINAAACDVDGDGVPEIALASGFSNVYARSLGIVSILMHQGDPRGTWSMKEIDRVPTSHRLRFADIDGTGRKLLINFPLIGADSVAPDYRGGVALLMYPPGDWKREVITDAERGVVHGILATSWDGGKRESLLSASFLGLYLLQYNPSNNEGGASRGTWTRTQIASGNPAEWPKSGSSDVIAGRLGPERFLAAVEPWHGNNIVVYRQRGGAWQRHPIDDSVVDAHTIVSGDFDGDRQDEIVVGERQGRRSAYVYRVVDAKQDTWTRETLDDGGMAGAGCAVADINADTRPDVVCIGTATANLKWYENRPPVQ